MGTLDEQSFEKAVAGCAKCDFKAFEVATYLDRNVHVLAGTSQNDGQWIHDDAKFFDGVFKIHCMSCQTVAFESPDCPRCHRANGLADALSTMSRLDVPMRCPSCAAPELTLTTFAPATVKEVEHQRAVPAASALLGELGYHVAHIACESCEWTQSAEGCPLCGGTGPLRARP